MSILMFGLILCPFWLMLLPKVREPKKELGLLFLPFIECGRCYCHVADGIATRVNYFVLVLADVIAMW